MVCALQLCFGNIFLFFTKSFPLSLSYTSSLSLSPSQHAPVQSCFFSNSISRALTFAPFQSRTRSAKSFFLPLLDDSKPHAALLYHGGVDVVVAVVLVAPVLREQLSFHTDTQQPSFLFNDFGLNGLDILQSAENISKAKNIYKQMKVFMCEAFT